VGVGHSLGGTVVVVVWVGVLVLGVAPFGYDWLPAAAWPLSRGDIQPFPRHSYQ